MIESTAAVETRMRPESSSALRRAPESWSFFWSVERATQRADESVEIAIGELSHDRDAEDGSIELPLPCVDDESVFLQSCVQCLVGFSVWKAERRERRAVVFFAFEQEADAEIGERLANELGPLGVERETSLPAAALRELVERCVERERDVGRKREGRRALGLIGGVLLQIEVDARRLARTRDRARLGE